MKHLEKKYTLKDSFVSLLTAVYMKNAVIMQDTSGSIKFLLVVTAGTTNASSPIDPPTNLWKTPREREEGKTFKTHGTINIILIIDGILPEHVLANLFIVITEAKTLILSNSNIRTKAQNVATGTTTDAIAVAYTNTGTAIKWSGYATEFGYTIGQLVMTALEKALKNGGYV